MPCTVEVICIGNELLIGKTLNTNVQWLAKQIIGLGGIVRRVTTVGDDVKEISSALRESISRKPHFIITTGGLGPTFDDKTLRGISHALTIPLKLSQKAKEIVKEGCKRHGLATSKLSSAYTKMARLPLNSEPLPNPVGMAPGVLIRYSQTIIVSLPGVPKEMKAIFEGSVVPLIRLKAGKLQLYESSLNVTHIVEPEIAPLIEKIMHDNPKIYIKSHPKRAEPIPLIELHFMTASKTEEKAKGRLKAAINQIVALLSEHGGKIEKLSEPKSNTY